MVSVLINYVYKVRMAGNIKAIVHGLLKITDALGVEVHFMRFLYWALLENTPEQLKKADRSVSDLMLLLFLIPLYWAGFHFYTAEVR